MYRVLEEHSWLVLEQDSEVEWDGLLTRDIMVVRTVEKAITAKPPLNRRTRPSFFVGWRRDRHSSGIGTEIRYASVATLRELYVQMIVGELAI